jgi:SET domain-containing protein
VLNDYLYYFNNNFFFFVYNMSEKRLLLDNLKNNVYCRIGRSNIHGVGVIAIKNINKGENPFCLTNDEIIDYKLIYVPKEDIKKLHSGVKDMIKAFFTAEKDGGYYLPYNGLNSLDISFYLNHDQKNNLDIIMGETDFYEFRSNKLIKKGEELTINYEHYKKN